MCAMCRREDAFPGTAFYGHVQAACEAGRRAISIDIKLSLDGCLRAISRLLRGGYVACLENSETQDSSFEPGGTEYHVFPNVAALLDPFVNPGHRYEDSVSEEIRYTPQLVTGGFNPGLGEEIRSLRNPERGYMTHRRARLKGDGGARSAQILTRSLGTVLL
ncbi:hypothetical protein BDZ89DRAFT_1052496 [Hymenopellis radicata]|nr:hypothetical protein BDZ89DRAFT_1052496 [Hymenopellis radicata]